MDPKDPLLSHQYEAVLALADDFDQITVITGKVGQIDSIPKIRIISTNWNPGHGLKNIFRLFVCAIPEIVRGDFGSVFYHMTDLQSALVSPLVRLRRKKQFLWYAHTFKSKYLIFASWWVTGIITSTSGSCPLSGKFVWPIGQAIDKNKFKPIPFEKLKFNKLIHIGRFDRSKNIDLLISTAEKLKRTFPNIELTIVGSPANLESRRWAKLLVEKYKSEIDNGWLKFKEAIPRNQFANEMAENGCFFHGYIGSLDKTLIEATMLRVPVITLNPEYLSLFGKWSNTTMPDLGDEYIALAGLDQNEINQELDRRLAVALRDHSLGNWVYQLAKILK
jgi:glycosyltransferase involved in cell wall biosynthesis